MVHIGPFGPFWFTFVYFGPSLSTSVISVQFGPFCLIQSTFVYSVHIKSFGSTLVHLVLFGPFSLLQSIRSSSVHLGPLCLFQSTLVLSVHFSPFCLFGPFRSIRKGNYDVLLRRNRCYCWVISKFIFKFYDENVLDYNLMCIHKYF